MSQLAGHYCLSFTHMSPIRLYTPLSFSPLSLSFSQETQESYGNRNQPAGNAGKPNHDEMGLMQQDRPSSLPVSDASVDQSERRIKRHVSSVKWRNKSFLLLFISEKARNSISIEMLLKCSKGYSRRKW